MRESYPTVTDEPAEQENRVERTEGVTLALLREAQDKQSEGQLERAAELIERAIRIEPRRGDLWVSLARVHYQNSDFGRAEQYARKGLTLLPVGSQQERGAWLLIADTLEARGDVDGARRIREQWRTFRG